MNVEVNLKELEKALDWIKKNSVTDKVNVISSNGLQTKVFLKIYDRINGEVTITLFDCEKTKNMKAKISKEDNL